MSPMNHSRSRSVRDVARIMVATIVAGSLVVVATGCAASSMQKPMSSGAPAKPSSSMVMAANSDPSMPRCYECSGKGKPPVVSGAATIANGAQVVNIKIEDGYYVPNQITVKAGMPTTVVFTGKAQDCVGKPKFAALNKQIDIRKTGTGTIDLGSLSAGTYGFSCGMGADQGSIIAK